MSVIHLPFGRFGADERSALRDGLAGPRAVRPGLRVVDETMSFCATCAAPIEFGAVMRRGMAYCSIACSLGGDRPA